MLASTRHPQQLRVSADSSVGPIRLVLCLPHAALSISLLDVAGTQLCSPPADGNVASGDVCLRAAGILALRELLAQTHQYFLELPESQRAAVLTRADRRLRALPETTEITTEAVRLIGQDAFRDDLIDY